ncbi:DUF4190 domain-containing protein [Herbiconiux sp. P17]|uniref:DUF4190 domain-containing protein n=1 Tax=Herbiconiux wuyangfengii TaxID=3342794 RepID=UPI0035B873F5
MTTGEQPKAKKIVNRPGAEPVGDSGPNYSYPFAIVGLVAGVVSLFVNFFLLPSIIGFIFGGVGIRHSLLRRTPEGAKPGFGLSLAGLVLSALGAIGSVVLFVITWNAA